VIEQGIPYLPSWFVNKLNRWCPDEWRRPILKWVAAVGLVVATFQTYDDARTQQRVLEDEKNTLARQLATGTPSQQQDSIDKLKQGVDYLNAKLSEKEKKEQLKREGRHLTAAAISRLKEQLTPIVGIIKEVSVGAEQDAEAIAYATEFDKFFNSISIKGDNDIVIYLPALGSPNLSVAFRGMQSPPESARKLHEALSAAGIDSEYAKMDNLKTDVGIIVGNLK